MIGLLNVLENCMSCNYINKDFIIYCKAMLYQNAQAVPESVGGSTSIGHSPTTTSEISNVSITKSNRYDKIGRPAGTTVA